MLREACRWLGLAACLAVSFGCGGSQAQDYPSRPVRIIVPTGPGGATDTTARSVAKSLSETLGQPFVVENQPGVQGLLAASMFVKEKPDGYTLLLMASSQSVLPAFYELPYDPVADFSPIARLSFAPVILVVNSKLPVKSVPELIEYAKKNPGKITYGYQGGPPQLACAQFAKVAGIDAIPVPYNASAQVATELLAGRLTFTVMTSEQAKVQVAAGKLRALATAGEKRAVAFPDIPTLEEVGYPAYGTGWFGLVGPRDLPKPILDKLYTTLKTNYIGKEGQAQLVKSGLEPAEDGPVEFTAALKSEVGRWLQTARDLGITPTKP